MMSASCAVADRPFPCGFIARYAGLCTKRSQERSCIRKRVHWLAAMMSEPLSGAQGSFIVPQRFVPALLHRMLQGGTDIP